MGEERQSELRRELAASRSLAEVQHALRDVCGVGMRVLFRDGGKTFEVFPPPDRKALSRFCAAVRKSPEGRKRCMMCQSLIALSASYEGLTEHHCHGGVSILASPARSARPRATNCLVVESGGFLRVRNRQTWQAVSRHLTELKISGNEAREAYDALPLLTEEQASVGRHLLAIAATVVGDVVETRLDPEGPTTSAPRRRDTAASEDTSQALHAAFTCYDDANTSVPGPKTGNRLVDLIVAVVARTPDMDFTLTNLARAAQVTPSHLSTLFHRHYGARFSEFLVEQRVKTAMRMLQDHRLSVEQVARQCGFNNVSYFCKCFRRHTGTTPGRWRQTQHTAPSDPSAAPPEGD